MPRHDAKLAALFQNEFVALEVSRFFPELAIKLNRKSTAEEVAGTVLALGLIIIKVTWWQAFYDLSDRMAERLLWKPYKAGLIDTYDPQGNDPYIHLTALATELFSVATHEHNPHLWHPTHYINQQSLRSGVRAAGNSGTRYAKTELADYDQRELERCMEGAEEFDRWLDGERETDPRLEWWAEDTETPAQERARRERVCPNGLPYEKWDWTLPADPNPKKSFREEGTERGNREDYRFWRKDARIRKRVGYWERQVAAESANRSHDDKPPCFEIEPHTGNPFGIPAGVPSNVQTQGDGGSLAKRKLRRLLLASTKPDDPEWGNF